MTAPRESPCRNCNGDGCIRFVNRSADPRWDGPIRCPVCLGVGYFSRDGVTLFDLANMVCRDIPLYWKVTIVFEREAGWVELRDPDGHRVEYSTNRETIEEQLVDALRHAISAEERAVNPDEGGN